MLLKFSKADADFFYALKKNFAAKWFCKRFIRQIIYRNKTCGKMLLYDAALVDGKKIEEDIKVAIFEKIVDPNIAKRIKPNLEILF